MASKAIGFLNFKFSADLSNFERAMKKAQKNLNKFGKNIKKTGKTLTTSLTLPIVALGALSVKAFDEQEKAIAQVNAGLESTGGTVGRTTEELQKMARELQKVSLFGDEDILKNVTAQLLTFTNIVGEEFEKTQQIALDLATRLDGDLKSASIMLGKALNDPVANLSALSRAGIQFSIDQKTLIKSLVETGNLAEAQSIILAELEKQYGGSAEAARKAGLGPIQALQMVLSDLSEQIGERLLPFIQKFAEFVVHLAEKFDNLSEKTKDNIVLFGVIVAAIGPLLIIFGQLAIAAAALIPVFTAIVAILFSIPSIIAGAIAALGFFATSSSNLAVDVRNHFVDMVNGIILAINDMIAALNIVSSLFGKFIPFIDLLEREEHKLAETNKELNKELNGIFKIIKDLQSGKGFKGLTTTTNKYNESLDPLIKNIKEYADISKKLWSDEGLQEGPENMLNFTEKLTFAQRLLNAGYQMFGDVVGNSMNEAIDSQESFFSVFIKNIKRAIRSLLIQLAVLTLIKVLMGDTAAFSLGSIKGSLGQIMNVQLEKGGLITGPTTALIGEGIGTNAGNPEVVAPLNKLKQFMGGGNNNIVVTGKLVGNDIYLSNQNASINRRRTV